MEEQLKMQHQEPIKILLYHENHHSHLIECLQRVQFKQMNQQNYQLNAKKFKDSGFDLQKFLHEEIDREFERINPWKNLTQFVIKNSKVNPSQKESQIKNEQIQGKSMGDKMEEYIKKINDMKNQIKFDILRKQQMKGKNRSNSKKVKRISGSIKVAAPSLTPQQQDKVNGLLIDKQQENSQAANSDQLIQEFKIRRSINNRMNPNPPKAQSKINLLNLDLQKTENPQVQENQPKPSLFLKLHKDEAKSLLQNMSGLICYQSEGFQLGKSTDSKAKLNLANQYEITDPKSVQCLKKNEERLLALKKGLREIENRYQSNQLILEQAQQTYSRFQFRRFSEPYQEKQGDQDAYIFRPRTSEINYYQQLNNNQSNPKNERIERSSRAHHNSVILNTSLYDKYSNHHQSSSTHKLCKIDSQLNPSSNPSQSNKIFNHKPQLNHLKNQSVQNFSTPQQTTKKNHSSNQNLLRRSHELKHVTNLNKILNRLCQPDYYPNLDYIQHKNANFTSRKPKVIRFSNIGEKDNDITSQRGKRIHGSQVLLGKLDIHQIKLRSWKEQIRLQNVEMVV
eukprot:403340072